MATKRLNPNTASTTKKVKIVNKISVERDSSLIKRISVQTIRIAIVSKISNFLISLVGPKKNLRVMTPNKKIEASLMLRKPKIVIKRIIACLFIFFICYGAKVREANFVCCN